MRELDGASPLALDEFGELLAPYRIPKCWAIGVSGGGDSMALAVLARAWAQSTGRRVEALTVDHGIRESSAREAEQVAAWCHALGIGHATLSVRDPAPGTGVQAWARARRLEFLARWAQAHGGAPVMLAHTLEDQAETLLMRLSRGAGVDGLAAMRGESRQGDLRILRPLLAVPRSRLRATLRAQGQDWIEDPSNYDESFERVRVRRAMHGLALDPAPLARVAGAMERVRLALQAEAGRLIERCAWRGTLGEIVIDLRILGEVEEEFAARVLSRAICGAGGRNSAHMRHASLDAALHWALARDSSPRGRSLAGCVLRKIAGPRLMVMREPASCEPPIALCAGQEALWDGRWRVWYKGPGSVQVGALGCPAARNLGSDAAEWRQSPLLLRASVPAFRRGSRILAVPGAGLWQNGCEGDGGAEFIPSAL